MNCIKCGASLSDDTLFCTECGHKVGEDITTRNSNQKKTKENLEKYSSGLDKIIIKYGETNILKFTIYAGLVFLLSIKILGFLLTSILLSVVNGYLIFSKYRNTKALDMKMLMFSVLVLCIGIICSII